MRHVGLMLLVLGAGCEASALESHEHLPRLRSALEPFDVTVEAAPTRVTALGYQAPPADCTHVYRIDIDYEPPRAHEDPSTSYLAFGHHPDDDAFRPVGTIPDGETFAGRTHYEGIRVRDPGVSRDVWLSAEHAGPASPTAGCLGQTWDPIEDALTLGWPKLTARLTAVEETWAGLRVGGKCNKSACVDPKTGRGGADNPKRTCVTDNFVQRLGGIYEIGGERFALVTGTWTDGHGPPDAGNTVGIWSESWALISVEHGRPAWARTIVHHNFAQQLAEGGWGPITRTWRMQGIDDCPGSLASVGWTRPAQDVEQAHEHTEALADSDELRKRHKRAPRRSIEPPHEGDPAQASE